MDLEELRTKAKQRKDLEKEILENVPGEGDDTECTCDSSDKEPFEYIHNGNLFYEVMIICLRCGGMIEDTHPHD